RGQFLPPDLVVSGVRPEDGRLTPDRPDNRALRDGKLRAEFVDHGGPGLFRQAVSRDNRVVEVEQDRPRQHMISLLGGVTARLSVGTGGYMNPPGKTVTDARDDFGRQDPSSGGGRPAAA